MSTINHTQSTFGLPTRFYFLKSHPPSPNAVLSTYGYRLTNKWMDSRDGPPARECRSRLGAPDLIRALRAGSPKPCLAPGDSKYSRGPHERRSPGA
ncbi:hypothetical protein RSAG8_06937, partial [Rhizoctonia solani AG-8 WAC10335]